MIVFSDKWNRHKQGALLSTYYLFNLHERSYHKKSNIRMMFTNLSMIAFFVAQLNEILILSKSLHASFQHNTITFLVFSYMHAIKPKAFFYYVARNYY